MSNVSLSGVALETVSIVLTLKNGNIVSGLNYAANLPDSQRELIISQFIAQNIVWDNAPGVMDKTFNSAAVVGIQIVYKGKDWSSVFPQKRFRTETIDQSLRFIGRMFSRICTDAKRIETLPDYSGEALSVPSDILAKIEAAKIKAAETREETAAKLQAEYDAMTAEQRAKFDAAKQAERDAKQAANKAAREAKKAQRLSGALSVLGVESSLFAGLN